MEELRQKLYNILVEHNFDLTNKEVVKASKELDKELNNSERSKYFKE